jgi:hypothetical protein
MPSIRYTDPLVPVIELPPPHRLIADDVSIVLSFVLFFSPEESSAQLFHPFLIPLITPSPFPFR